MKRITTKRLCDLLFGKLVSTGRVKRGGSVRYDDSDVGFESLYADDMKEEDITDYEFDIEAVPGYGACEGIYLDIFISGVYRQGMESSRKYIGHIKTLSEDRAAMEYFGLLAGCTTYYGRALVNELINRFTPDRLVTKELERLSADRDRIKLYFDISDESGRDDGYVFAVAGSTDRATEWFGKSIYSGQEYRMYTEDEFRERKEKRQMIDYVSLR